MKSTSSFLDKFRQNEKLPIRIISPDFGHVPQEVSDKFGNAHQTSYYYFLFMIEGYAEHGIDLNKYVVNNDEVLFILPNQMHELPINNQSKNYFKIGFDETCLSLLPKQYPFLINPFNIQKIKLNPSGSTRLKHVFAILLELLSTMDTEAELILAHLNSLLTEINTAYFFTEKNPTDNKLSKYIDFKAFVENNLTKHPTVQEITKELGMNPNSLYHLIKQYSGLSPKEFIINRLILEAKRRLFYNNNYSIKELAYQLGFNDPEYFSRLFKKVTGKTVAMFLQDLSGK